MAITKKPQSSAQTTAKVDSFIESAPDGNLKKKSDESVQITIRLTTEQLNRITAIAKRQGIPRASYMKRSVFIQLEQDEKN